MKLEKFYLCCKVGVCIAAMFALFGTPLIVNHQLTGLRKDAKIEVSDTRKAAVELINQRADSLQTKVTDWLGTADKRIGSLEKTVDGRLSSLETNTFQTVNTASDRLFTQVGQTNKDLFARVDTLSTNINTQLSTANGNVTRLTDVYAALPSQVGARFDQQTNCGINELCWQNLGTALLRDSHYTMVDVSSASKTFSLGFPIMVKNTNEITGNFAGITKNIEYWTHPRWYERAFGYVGKGALIYNTFSPATQAIKGTIAVVDAVKK